MDIHINHRILELLLAPAVPTDVHRIWCTSQWCVAGETRHMHGGTFAVSGVLHDVGLGAWAWDGALDYHRFFMLMGVGGVLEFTFEWLMEWHMVGLCGWVWTMVWTVCWGTLMIDGWAQQGIVTSDFFPDRHQPEKWLVDTVIALSSKWR
jgi:hypothetical protein